MSPSVTRDRLSNGVFIPQSADNPIGLLEIALPRVIATEPLERRLLKAQAAGDLDAIDAKGQLEQALAKSIITSAEAKELQAVRAMVAEIIAVDEFESEYLQMGVSVAVGAVSEQAD